MYVKINDWKEAVFILMVLGLFFFMINKLYLKEMAHREGIKKLDNKIKGAFKNAANAIKKTFKSAPKKTLSAIKGVAKKAKNAAKKKAKNAALYLKLLQNQEKIAKKISELNKEWNKTKASIPTISIGNIVERHNNYVRNPRRRGEKSIVKNLVPMFDVRGSSLPTILINAVIPFSKKGETGDKGIPGIHGDKGPKGPPGEQGIPGNWGKANDDINCPRN